MFFDEDLFGGLTVGKKVVRRQWSGVYQDGSYDHKQFDLDSLIKIIIKVWAMKYSKHNRSLKDLRIQAHHFKEDPSSIASTIKVQHPPSPSQFTLDSISKTLNQLHPSAEILKQTYIKGHKYTKSHSRLDIPTPIKFQGNSPRVNNTDVKTQRQINKKSAHENIEISPFDLRKSTLKILHEPRLNILTPSNRNICIEEPKRHKILSKRQPTFFEEFKMGKVLGKGRFGSVYIVQHNTSNFVGAVKQISLDKASPKLIERLVYEIKIQTFVKHQNILELYKYYKEGNYLYLLIELGSGSLWDKLRVKKYFSEAESANYIEQTVRALVYLHSNGIIHRDLKPENIVLINNTVKLADFGWSIYVGTNDKRSTFCGTLDYVSPEIVMGSQYDHMVDVWSVGVLCYELCTGHAPFESTKSREETYRKILNVDLKFPKALSEDVKDFIKKLLEKKPEDRMSLDEALEHKWIKKYSTAK